MLSQQVMGSASKRCTDVKGAHSLHLSRLNPSRRASQVVSALRGADSAHVRNNKLHSHENFEAIRAPCCEAIHGGAQKADKNDTEPS